MKAKYLQPNQRFRTRLGPEIFTLVEPVEPVGGVLLMKVRERPGDTMSLMVDDDVTLVD